MTGTPASLNFNLGWAVGGPRLQKSAGARQQASCGTGQGKGLVQIHPRTAESCGKEEGRGVVSLCCEPPLAACVNQRQPLHTRGSRLSGGPKRHVPISRTPASPGLAHHLAHHPPPSSWLWEESRELFASHQTLLLPVSPSASILWPRGAILPFFKHARHCTCLRAFAPAVPSVWNALSDIAA